MKAGTVPYEEHVIDGRATYRIPRVWLEEELKKRGEIVTVEEAHERTLDLLTAFESGVERLEASDERTRAEVETQHTQLVPLSEKALENQRRVLGNLGDNYDQSEFYKQIREVTARVRRS